MPAHSVHSAWMLCSLMPCEPLGQISFHCPFTDSRCSPLQVDHHILRTHVPELPQVLHGVHSQSICHGMLMNVQIIYGVLQTMTESHPQSVCSFHSLILSPLPPLSPMLDPPSHSFLSPFPLTLPSHPSFSCLPLLLPLTPPPHPSLSPLPLTPPSHPCLSPLPLTPSYSSPPSHPSPSPLTLTPPSHPSLSPLPLTPPSHPSLSPLLLTPPSHPSLSPLVTPPLPLTPPPPPLQVINMQETKKQMVNHIRIMVEQAEGSPRNPCVGVAEYTANEMYSLLSPALIQHTFLSTETVCSPSPLSSVNVL